MDDAEFSRKLMEAFAIEADEHLKAITAGVLELEKTPDSERRKELVETTFREAHSLKGAARAVNRSDVESVCQALEGVLALWKRQPRAISAEDFDVLNRTIDVVGRQLAQPSFSEDDGGRQEVRAVISKLRLMETSPDPGGGAGAGGSAAAPSTPEVEIPEPAPSEPERVQVAETVRVPVGKMNSLLRKAEGMVGIKLATRRCLAELHEVGSLVDSWRTAWSKARDAVAAGRGGVDGASNAAGAFIEWDRDFLVKFEEKLRGLAKRVEADERSASTAVDDLLADAKELLMLPFATLLDLFPKQVRDLSREQGKEVELVIGGREVEIDKRILEEMKDAMVHLVRNAIDHGLESPDIRAARGKSRRGTLHIAVARREGNRIVIEIADDGAGIDVEKVKASAVRQGVVTAADAGQMSREAALGLIFKSGVTASPIITDLSGRGLGMAIVRERVERLGGQITIEAEPGGGTAFRIALPVTLATFKGLVVSASGQTFVIPTSGVERIDRIRRDAIRNVENRPTVNLSGRVVSLASLSEILGLPGSASGSKSSIVEIVVLGANDSRIAFAVDEVLAEQEVLVKPLVKPLVRVRNVSSAALLGSGTPVLILNVADLLKSAARMAGSSGLAAKPVKEEEVRQRRVLVADDSVTSRMLLRNIVESAGYHVTTAVDGLEAFGTLQREPFDLLVTDAEMPRMGGFELTARIRADKKLAELPVVIVTALGSREDRDRGVESGANAYIVKSSFDQNNLIEILGKLIS